MSAVMLTGVLASSALVATPSTCPAGPGFRTDAYQYWKVVKPGRLCGERHRPASTPRLIATKPKNR